MAIDIIRKEAKEKTSSEVQGELTEATDTVAGLVPSYSSGTYTPTSSSTSNVTVTNINDFHYLRVGSIVTVTGSVNVTATATPTDCTFKLTVPIARSTNFSTGEAGGTGFVNHVANTTNGKVPVGIYEDSATTNKVIVIYTPYNTLGGRA